MPTPRKAPTAHQKEAAWNKLGGVRGKSRELYGRDVQGNVLYKPSIGKKYSETT